MNRANLLTYEKWGLVFIGFALLLVLRQDAWLAGLRLNRVLVTYNQFPAWQAIVNDNLLSDIPLLLPVNEDTVDDVSLARGHGLLLFVQGQEAEAITVWEAAGLSPAEITAVQGHYARSVNHPQAAVAWYERTVELDPALLSAWHALGELYQQRGEASGAIAAYEQAFSLGDVTSVDPLAKLWWDAGNYEVAVNIWQSALESHPTVPGRLRWWQELCNSLRATNKWDVAIEATQIALSEFPDDPQLRVERGYALYYAVSDFTKAIAEFQQAITLDENMAIAYVAIGELMVAEENYEEAIYWYSLAIDRNSGNRLWHLARAEAALAKGDFTQSLRLFEEIIRLWPDLAHAHYRIALVYRQVEQPENAVNAIEQAIVLADQPNPQYFFRAAVIFEWIGENEQALRAYQQVLMLEPSHELAKQGVERLNDLID